MNRFKNVLVFVERVLKRFIDLVDREFFRLVIVATLGLIAAGGGEKTVSFLRSAGGELLRESGGPVGVSFFLVLTGTAVVALISLVTLARVRNVTTTKDEHVEELRDLVSGVLRAQTYNKWSGRRVDESLSRMNQRLLDLTKRFESSDGGDKDEWKIFGDFRARMANEQDRIQKSSRTNLYFGILFSGIALAFLGYPLMQADHVVEVGQASSVFEAVFQKYIPRLSVGILIQVVGFFFLRLYVTNELDLKHTKNEITNFEAWMVSAILAVKYPKSKATEMIVKSLASTERNFVIKKSDKTVHVEALQSSDLTDLIKALFERISIKAEIADKRPRVEKST